MRSPTRSNKEAIVRYFTAPFYWLFCIVYFVVSLPQRFRRRRIFRNSPKKILWRRLALPRVKALEASSLILQLREAEQPDEFLMRRSPTIFELLEMLWEEELSACWKFPMVSELEQIRDEIAGDIRAHIDAQNSGTTIWAIDDGRHVFVGYDPLTGTSVDAFPQFLDATQLYKRPPDSKTRHVAYAVSVLLRRDD